MKNQNNNSEDTDNNQEGNKTINNILSKTLKNTSSVFIISLISKIISFLCNIILVRYISKDSYGTAKIYLEFALSLVCFFPRETIRKTAQKFCPDKDTEKETKKYYLVCQVYSLIFIPMIAYCFLLFFGFIAFDSSGNMKINCLHLLIYIFSGMIELLAEHIIIYMNLHMENILIGITLGDFIRIISNVILVVIIKIDLGSFTFSRLLGSIFYLIYFLILGKFKYNLDFVKFIPKTFSFLLNKEEKIIDGVNISPLKEVLFQFVKLSLLNMVLSNCENLILSFVLKNTNEEKGEYSFILENFSIITRLILKPIEDTFFNLINKLKNYKNTKDKNNNLIFDVLKLFIKCLSIFGILLISYYFLCGKDLIELVYSKKWSTNTTDKIGCAYSIYIAIISINGVIECFANATNNSEQMNISYLLLTLNSVLLVSLMAIFSNWDTCGLILANAISMIFRINGNLYIIFCGKKEKEQISDIDNKKYKTNLILDIKSFQNNCFLSNSSLLLTSLCLILGHFIKRFIDKKIIIIKCGIFGFIGVINVVFIGLFEFKSIKKSIGKIKNI